MNFPKAWFEKIAIRFISYSLVGYMLGILYVNLVFVLDKEKYIDSLPFYSFLVGMCLWSSLTYFCLSFTLPYCRETRLLATTLLLMTIIYGIRMEDDIYNILLQIFLATTALLIFFGKFVNKILQNKNCKLTILFDFLTICIRNKFNCRKSLTLYLEQQKNIYTND